MLHAQRFMRIALQIESPPNGTINKLRQKYMPKAPPWHYIILFQAVPITKVNMERCSNILSNLATQYSPFAIDTGDPFVFRPKTALSVQRSSTILVGLKSSKLQELKACITHEIADVSESHHEYAFKGQKKDANETFKTCVSVAWNLSKKDALVVHRELSDRNVYGHATATGLILMESNHSEAARKGGFYLPRETMEPLLYPFPTRFNKSGDE